MVLVGILMVLVGIPSGTVSVPMVLYSD
jgi:hypothetical protein